VFISANVAIDIAELVNRLASIWCH